MLLPVHGQKKKLTNYGNSVTLSVFGTNIINAFFILHLSWTFTKLTLLNLLYHFGLFYVPMSITFNPKTIIVISGGNTTN